MKTEKIIIENLHTENDAQRISTILHDVWGIRAVEIDKQVGEATISFNENAAALHDFQQALRDGGYEIKNEEDQVKQ